MVVPLREVGKDRAGTKETLNKQISFLGIKWDLASKILLELPTT